MPSYRSQFCRMLIKYLVAIKFNPNKTIDEMRRGVESLSKLAGLPSKTNVEKIKMNYPAAELRSIKMNFYLINPDAEHRGILLIK